MTYLMSVRIKTYSLGSYDVKTEKLTFFLIAI